MLVVGFFSKLPVAPVLALLLATASQAAALGSAARASANRDSSRRIRVMTYNVHAWRDSDHRDNYGRVLDVIGRVDPDILCLNEVLHPFVAPSTTDGAHEYFEAVKRQGGRGVSPPKSSVPRNADESFLHLLAESSGLVNWDFRAATDDCFFGRVPFGNAILSRFPIKNCAHVPLLLEPGDIALGEQPRDVVDPRLFSAATVVLPEDCNSDGGGETNLGVCFAHLDQKSEELREKQMLRALSAMEEQMGDTPHVFCGDLNTFQSSDCNSEGWAAIQELYSSRGWPEPRERSLVLDALMEADYKDAFYQVEAASSAPGTLRPSSLDGGLESVDGEMQRGDFPGPTCWTKKTLNVMRIDHLWTSPQRPGAKFRIQPRQYSRVLTDASDHFPIFADLDLVLN